MLEIRPVTGTEPVKPIKPIKKEDAHPSNRQPGKKKPEIKENEPGQPLPHIDELA
jgi:hypothetical protein